MPWYMIGSTRRSPRWRPSAPPCPQACVWWCWLTGGFGNAWLQQHGVDYMLRRRRGVSLTERNGTRWFLGRERLRRGAVRWHPQV